MTIKSVEDLYRLSTVAEYNILHTGDNVTKLLKAIRQDYEKDGLLQRLPEINLSKISQGKFCFLKLRQGGQIGLGAYKRDGGARLPVVVFDGPQFGKDPIVFADVSGTDDGDFVREYGIGQNRNSQLNTTDVINLKDDVIWEQAKFQDFDLKLKLLGE